MNFTCCLGCTKRVPGCHEDCEEYQAARERFKTQRDLMRKERDRQIESRAYINEHYDRRRRNAK